MVYQRKIVNRVLASFAHIFGTAFFKHSLRRLVWAFGVFAALSNASADAQAYPDDAALLQALRQYVDEHRGAPGIVLGVIDRNGQRVLSYGESGRAERPQVDGDTRFEIGSISKTFTGLLLADMQLAGEVSAEQSVSTLFPQSIALNNGVESLTLAQLATHTSGLPRLPLSLGMFSRSLSTDPYRGSSVDELFRAVADTPAEFIESDGAMLYSNLGYALLGRLLEQSGGQSYEQLLQRRVLLPLGLAGIETAHADTSSPLLARGEGRNGRPASYWHLDAYAPAGSLIASTNDMLRYLRVQLDAQHPAVIEAQRPRLQFETGRVQAIGLGWMHSTIGGHRLIWHNGGTGGFRSFIGFLPDEQRGFVLLSNGNGNLDTLARHLIDPSASGPKEYRFNIIELGITLLLLAWGPWLLIRAARMAALAARAGQPASLPSLPAAANTAPVPVRMDRMDVICQPLTALLALLLAERVGTWLTLPFAIWWLALAVCAAAFAVQLRYAPLLPWYVGRGWRSVWRWSSTVITLMALFVLLS